MSACTWRCERVMPAAALVETLRVRQFGLCDYTETWHRMRGYTAARGPHSADEVWALEHPPVFTLGLGGKPEHLLNPGLIPVVYSDRGGQVTYHGPGQLVTYVLIDLARRGWGVKRLVHALEQAVIDLCADFGVQAQRRSGAPGVYVGQAKLAALGLRVRRGCSYHGLALNVAMDLEPYSRINPCGDAALRVTQIRDLGIQSDMETLRPMVLSHLSRCLREQHRHGNAA
ncbi:MAG: lipoyl(octanoyl) transferase LipB [Gammaproteobacteria bacterium]